MSPLTNARWERFAQLIASGRTGAAAYRDTYGANGATAEANASRLLRKAMVRARVAELQTAAATDAVMTLAEKRRYLALIVRTAPGDIDEQSALCQSVRRTEEGITITMPDKLRAIELDAKLAGEIKPVTTIAATAVNVAAPQSFVLTEELRLVLMERRRVANLQAQLKG